MACPVPNNAIIIIFVFEDSEYEIGDTDSDYEKLGFHRTKKMFLTTKKCLILLNKKLFRSLMN